MQLGSIQQVQQVNMLGIPVLFDAGQCRIEFARHHGMATIETYRCALLIWMFQIP